MIQTKIYQNQKQKKIYIFYSYSSRYLQNYIFQKLQYFTSCALILNNKYFITIIIHISQMTQNINPWTVLTTSPFILYGRPDGIQTFKDMIFNLLAPYYRIKSLTTILIFIPFAIYITLVVRYPPFLKIPSFASQPLQLHPQNLQHYQFYRLFTAPFVYTELSTLVVSCFITCSLGSFIQQFLGWKMLIVFTGFQGLIGYTYQITLICFLVGCYFAYILISWPDPNNPVLYRKITLVLYLIIGLIYILFFINLQKQQKYSSYLSTVYGMVLTFMVGSTKDGANLATYRKISMLASYIIFIFITSLLILNIVLYRITIV